MTETEKKLIEDLKPRLVNYKRVYGDRYKKNISITYAVEKALRLVLDKTDFSMDYTGRDEDYDPNFNPQKDFKDADLLNFAWVNLSTEGTSELSIGTHGLNVRIAKFIVLLYVFAPYSSLEIVARKIWKIKRQKLSFWIDDALIFFALRIKFLENTLDCRGATK